MFDISTLLVLCPGLPLAAAILTGLLGPRVLRGQAHVLTIVGLAAASLCAFALLFQVHQDVSELSSSGVSYERIVKLWNWLHIDEAYDGSRVFTPDAASSPTDQGTSLTSSRPLSIDIVLRLDPLTAIMLVTVNFVALLVAIYSVGYMHHDPGYWRFFAFISLFVFCMNILVTASNFLILFAAWEGVGVCSYLLIGFWYSRPAAAAAGKKAFLVNRVGDFGFTLAMFFIWLTYGTLNFHDLPGAPGVLGETRLASGAFVGGGLGLAICLLLLTGACGKSAQFPLHVWLADAMEGPTPVSALIHAATMVTAGVYLVARCIPLFMVSPTAQLVLACVGAGTALMAAVIALTQFDLKRVLAYSTISQLGYMFLGLGVGTMAGVTAGVFHLFTHAFFKALLFLGAGSVMHAMGNVIDMRRFGGLRKVLPITHLTYAVGCLALAGVIPFAGFWSKDAILAALRDQSVAAGQAGQHAEPTHSLKAPPPSVAHTQSPGRGSSNGGTSVIPASHSEPAQVPHGPSDHALSTAHFQGWMDVELRRAAWIFHGLYYLSFFTAFLTAVYTFRALYMTFHGQQRIPPEAGDHAHESPPVMWIPLAILAVGSVSVGWLMERNHVFAHFLEHTPSWTTPVMQTSSQLALPHGDVALWSTLVALAGVGFASYFYLGSLRQAEWLRQVFSFPAGGLYQLSRSKFFLDEIYDFLIVWPLRILGKILYFLDQYLVDGIVDGIGSLPKRLGNWPRRMQWGLVPYYGLVMALGIGLLWTARWYWS